ncbi:MAG: hypothetical protein JXO72_05935, partial [Vicinamibacteria bacterium]|nr:hypothetical protein [Vicinamibacteria bacterium]
EQIDADETRLREMKQGAREMSSTLAMRIALTQDAPPERVLAAIENILPAGARLDGITLQYGDALAVTFMVVARRPEIYDVFLERMESSSSFTDLSFGAESRDGEIRVSIDAAYLGGGRS